MSAKEANTACKAYICEGTKRVKLFSEAYIFTGDIQSFENDPTSTGLTFDLEKYS